MLRADIQYRAGVCGNCRVTVCKNYNNQIFGVTDVGLGVMGVVKVGAAIEDARLPL